MRVCFKRNPQDFKIDANIFVKNIPLNMTTKELEELC